ncbi:MAG: sigma54 specific transcriptional regulator, Fis family [Sedimentibacter sp.]|jgi:PAS domain S-box-containing protein|nr:sigma54 specific transcriptional regulator, Fis family [Sedimentibacter sp.]
MLNEPLVIQTIQQVAKSISAVLNVEIMIMDNKLNKLGGTVNIEKSYYISNVYKYVMDTGNQIIIDEPGFHELCIKCKNYKCCPEKAEFDFPIKIDDEVVGILSLVGYTDEHKKIMLSRKHDYITFLEIMCQMISTKALEVSISKKLNVSAMQITHIFNSINEGIIATDENGIITHFSKAAEKLLRISRENISGKIISSIFPEILLKNKIYLPDYEKREMKAFLGNGKQITCYVSTNVIKDQEQEIAGMIITIFDSNDIKKIVRNMMGYDNKSLYFSDIIGHSSIINNAKQKAEIAAKGHSTIIIRGESGTGKELFARAIHNSSPMCEGPFIAINCAAIPETLLESELFGYEGGAFTGAKKEGKPGKFELADGGTLFLDEIGDMPLYLQAKLLRVLQEKVIQRVGGLSEISVNVRIISATNKDLEHLVLENRFREDLYYRLNVIPIFIPPLNDRKDDMPLLIEYLLNKYSIMFNKNIQSVNTKVMDVFMSYSWPGNVRELENIIEYAMNMEKSDVITESSIPKNLIPLSSNDEKESLDNIVKNFERSIIVDKLKRYGKSKEDKEKLAKDLNIGIATLYRKLKVLEIDE